MLCYSWRWNPSLLNLRQNLILWCHILNTVITNINMVFYIITLALLRNQKNFQFLPVYIFFVAPKEFITFFSLAVLLFCSPILIHVYPLRISPAVKCDILVSQIHTNQGRGYIYFKLRFWLKWIKRYLKQEIIY